MKFKFGDTVRIIKPIDLEYDVMYKDSTSNMEVLWVEEMDNFVGEEFKLTSYESDEGWVFQPVSTGTIGWLFLEDWLTLLNTEKDNIAAYNYAMGII